MAEQETILLGIVGIKNMGVYNPETQYEKLNVVTYQGSSYCATKNTKGNLPTNTDYWQLYAEKGATGDQGPKGDTGNQGPKGDTGNPGASPLVASSMSDMTDTSRIYVLTTDGHWYYYNGTTWADGGIYQAAEDSNTVEMLAEDITNEYKPDHSILGIVTGTGIITSGMYCYAKEPVESGKTYYLYRESQIYHPSQDFLGFFVNDNCTCEPIGNRIVTINGFKYLKIEVPTDVNYIAFNTYLKSFDERDTTRFGLYPTLINTLGYDIDLRNEIENNKSKFINNLYSIKYNYEHYFVKTISPYQTVNDNYSMAKVPVESNKTYYFYRKSGRYDIINDGIVYVNNGTVISSELLSSMQSVKTIEGHIIKEFTTPANTTEIWFNTKLNLYDDKNSTVVSENPTTLEMYGSDNTLREQMQNLELGYRLKDKKWLTLGDSITALTYRSTKNYHDYIAERTGIIVTNMGDSGKGYIVGHSSGKAMTDYVDNLTGNEGFDYITIAAGTNDNNEPLGTFSDTGTTTVYGAIRYCVEHLIEKFPNTKIGLITPLPRRSHHGIASTNQLYKIVKAIEEIGADYSIPVLDQYTKSGLRPWNTTNNETFFSCEQAPNGDGLHPNELGHEWISYPIQHFLELL